MNGFSTKEAVICLAIGLLLGLVQPILAATLSHVHIFNSACVLIGNSIALPFTVVLIIVSVGISIGLIITYSIVIHLLLTSSTFQATSTYSMKASIRLGAVILTNCIATGTITVMSILSLSHVDVLPSIEAVLLFVLIPCNACLNPIINTVTTTEFRPVRIYILMQTRKALNPIGSIVQIVYKLLLSLVRSLKLKYRTRSRAEFFRGT